MVQTTRWTSIDTCSVVIVLLLISLLAANRGEEGPLVELTGTADDDVVDVASIAQPEIPRVAVLPQATTKPPTSVVLEKMSKQAFAEPSKPKQGNKPKPPSTREDLKHCPANFPLLELHTGDATLGDLCRPQGKRSRKP